MTGAAWPSLALCLSLEAGGPARARLKGGPARVRAGGTSPELQDPVRAVLPSPVWASIRSLAASEAPTSSLGGWGGVGVVWGRGVSEGRRG